MRITWRLALLLLLVAGLSSVTADVITLTGKLLFQGRVSFASGTITTWTEVTGTTASMTTLNGYILNNVALVTATLPTTCALGDTVEIVGKGSGGWKLAQGASQLVHFGATPTTTGTGGYITSSNRYNALSLRCIVANTEWAVLGSQGIMDIN